MSNSFVEKNKKALSWWSKYYNSANDFRPNIEDVINVSIYDVMPNLRNEEFEIKEGVTSFSTSEIEVFTNKAGVLIICDGHHRFNDAINAGKERVDVVVKELNVSNIFTGTNFFYELSDEHLNQL